MSPQIQFQSGTSRSYTATRAFSLGGQNGMTISAGQEIEFDGTNVIHSGMPSIALPQLRGAVKAGWLVLSEVYDPNDMSASVRRSANIQVRSADGGNPMDPKPKTLTTTVDAEEQEVGNVAAHAQQTRNLNNNRRASTAGQRSNMNVAEQQDGIPVRSLSTPAKQSTNLETTSAAEAIRRADSVKIQAGQGRSREELMATMTQEEQETYVAQLGSRKASYVDDSPIVGRVAPIKNTSREGFDITNSVGGGVEIFDGGIRSGKDEVTTTQSEGISFTTTNGPKAFNSTPVRKVDTDPRRRIAKSICVDFPDNYVFEDSSRKKIARLQADYEDRPDVIQAVAAAETDPAFRERLIQEFPGAFE